MLLTTTALRQALAQVIENKTEQGHQTDGLAKELSVLPDSYDQLWAMAQRVADLPLRPDWPFHEPNDLQAIWAACDPGRPLGAVGSISAEQAVGRIEAAFLGSVCGCILGKPLEVQPNLDEIRLAAESAGEWPLNDYISEAMLNALGRRHRSWPDTVRERIPYIAADDDINYTLLGMVLLEEHGLDLNARHVMSAWLHNLPPLWTFGPERTMLIKAALNSGGNMDDLSDEALRAWVTVLNPGDEKCGALIRADAYGYACPGRPALAAELAWRDASWSHRRTGIYGAMFVAAAIATAMVADNWRDIFETALQFVPQQSRFYTIASDALYEVSHAYSWLDAYSRIHHAYGRYGHCLIYQECATMMNTLRFAQDVGDGICIQVMQGNDTDSFGATAGSLLGAFHGPGHLDARWLAPFNNTLHSTLACLHETSLSTLTQRMTRLPQRIGLML